MHVQNEMRRVFITCLGLWKWKIVVLISKVEESLRFTGNLVHCWIIWWLMVLDLILNLVVIGIRNIYFSTVHAGEIKGMLVEIRIKDGCTEGHGRWTLSSNEAYRFVYISCIISWLDGATMLVKSSVSVCLLNYRPAQAPLLFYTHETSALD